MKNTDNLDHESTVTFWDKNRKMRKTKCFTVGRPSSKDEAHKIADQWRNPEMGYHTEYFEDEESGKWIVRLVVNG